MNYTVIAIGEDYAVEYDCTENSRGVVNYCVHVMSRGRTMNQTLFDSLIKQAEELGLNSQALPVQMTLQKECV